VILSLSAFVFVGMLILSTERTGLFPSAPADAPVEANDGAESGKKDYDGYGQVRHDRLLRGMIHDR
jgi:hypothetical protein